MRHVHRTSRVARFADDGGFALGITIVIGVALMMVTALMIGRTARSTGNTGTDADWEQSLNVAESGIDIVLARTHIDIGYTTGEFVPTFSSAEEELDWVLDTAADLPTTAMPEGELVFMAPSNAMVAYAVGYVPSRSDARSRARVLRVAFQETFFKFDAALLTGGDLIIGGNSSTVDQIGEAGANVHANGTVSYSNNSLIDGCLTSTVSIIPEIGNCAASPAAALPMPDMDPRPYYQFAEVVLCPDGTVRAGPAHPDHPDPGSASTPCRATDPLVDDLGWKHRGFNNGVRLWRPSDASGVFYVYQGEVDGSIGKVSQNEPVVATIIAEGTGSWRSCSGATGGSITLSSGSYVIGHPSLGGYDTALLATADVKYRGGATVQGAIFAYEQVDYRGGVGSRGPVVAVSKCDSPFSPVSQTTVTNGGAVINYDGEVITMFKAGIEPAFWEEL